MQQIKRQLAGVAGSGYENAKREIGAALSECDEASLLDYAEQLVAAADVYSLLTGPVSDELANQIILYDDPFQLLCGRLYMARDVSKPSYFRELEDIISAVVDPTEDMEGQEEPGNQDVKTPDHPPGQTETGYDVLFQRFVEGLEKLSTECGIAIQVVGGISFYEDGLEHIEYSRDSTSGDIIPLRVVEKAGKQEMDISL